MKRLITISAGMLAAMVIAGCSTDGRQSSSNTGPDKTSLSTPSNANNTNAASATRANSNAAALENSFYTSAARGGMAEIELSKVAETKAANAEVKKFAQLMVTDHTKASEELKAVAAKKNITLPADLSPTHKATLNDLNGLTGADFDRTYVDAMVDAHETDVQLFEDQAADDKDPEAKAFATKTLPVIKRHLEMIKNIQSRLQ